MTRGKKAHSADNLVSVPVESMGAREIDIAQRAQDVVLRLAVPGAAESITYNSLKANAALFQLAYSTFGVNVVIDNTAPPSEIDDSALAKAMQQVSLELIERAIYFYREIELPALSYICAGAAMRLALLRAIEDLGRALPPGAVTRDQIAATLKSDVRNHLFDMRRKSAGRPPGKLSGYRIKPEEAHLLLTFEDLALLKQSAGMSNRQSRVAAADECLRSAALKNTLKGGPATRAQLLKRVTTLRDRANRQSLTREALSAMVSAR